MSTQSTGIAGSMIIPTVGGDPIPLVKDRILIGRRDDCDIRLEFANISGKHCELVWDGNLWLVRDLQSANGTKVNGEKIQKHAIYPGDQLTLARKHHFRIEYETKYVDRPVSIVDEEQDQNIMGKSLLERAGLQKARDPMELDSDLFEEAPEPIDTKKPKRYEL
jgi:adenylate cyclase